MVFGFHFFSRSLWQPSNKFTARGAATRTEISCVPKELEALRGCFRFVFMPNKAVSSVGFFMPVLQAILLYSKKVVVWTRRARKGT